MAQHGAARPGPGAASHQARAPGCHCIFCRAAACFHFLLLSHWAWSPHEPEVLPPPLRVAAELPGLTFSIAGSHRPHCPVRASANISGSPSHPCMDLCVHSRPLTPRSSLPRHSWWGEKQVCLRNTCPGKDLGHQIIMTSPKSLPEQFFSLVPQALVYCLLWRYSKAACRQGPAQPVGSLHICPYPVLATGLFGGHY